ncbi:unnamed protein product, partial [Didymodactylos carnosus]
MALISIWVGYTEPLANLWLDKIIDKLNYIKSQIASVDFLMSTPVLGLRISYLVIFSSDICVSPDLNYKLTFFGVTGDCPAIKVILDFVGHGGYWCCWICYLKDIHVDNKRQYRCELPIKHRHSEKYLQGSIQPVQENRDIFGHRGVSVLHKILDTPLPECIIIDYLHCTLLDHAKAIIKAIYHQFGKSLFGGTKAHCEAEFRFRMVEAKGDETDEEISSDEIRFVFMVYLDSYTHDNDMHRSRSDIQLYHKSPSSRRTNDKKTNEDSELDADEGSVNRLIDSRVDDRINTLLTSLNKKLDFMT